MSRNISSNINTDRDIQGYINGNRPPEVLYPDSYDNYEGIANVMNYRWRYAGYLTFSWRAEFIEFLQDIQCDTYIVYAYMSDAIHVNDRMISFRYSSMHIDDGSSIKGKTGWLNNKTYNERVNIYTSLYNNHINI
jgi:hypothetical protein